ncbi:MAG TPA: hypothetical protein VM715_05915, partial [Candidatus Acidoferrum sp.]|nr:hypothetical protein [Candidatus Acidoferrum sp.]
LRARVARAREDRTGSEIICFSRHYTLEAIIKGPGIMFVCFTCIFTVFGIVLVLIINSVAPI